MKYSPDNEADGLERTVTAPECDDPVAPKHWAGFVPGDRLARYVIVDELGAGGFGIVYRAYDPELNRVVALKVLRPRLRGGPAVSILREAQALAQLSHPNVVAVYDIGSVHDPDDPDDEAANQVFIAMQLVEGVTLREWLDQEPRSPREVLAAFVAAGSGLAAAHAAGIVHRDFKPANVLVGADGTVRVVDFGLARAPAASPRVGADVLGTSSDVASTVQGIVAGTPAYMAPEQFEGTADERSDQFSFFVALYEALCGERPFTGDSHEELRRNIESGEMRGGAQLGRVRGARALVMRGLRRNPEDRYPSMSDALAAIERLIARPRRVAAALGVTAVLGTAIAFAAVRPGAPRPSCSGFEERLAGAWDPAQRVAVRSALTTARPDAGDAVFSRVADVLDRYTAAWTAMSEAACRATHVQGSQSTQALDLRFACLDRRRNELAALTRRFARLSDSAEVDKVAGAALTLTPLDGCADVEALVRAVPPPADARVAEQVADARVRLDDAEASRRIGDDPSALALAEEVLTEARSIGYAPLTAEAGHVVTEALTRLEDYERAEKLLGQQVEVAAEARDDARAAHAWARLVYVVGAEGHRYDDAELLALAARASLARAGHPKDEEAFFAGVLGTMRRSQHRYEEAQAELERALALYKQLHPAGSPRIASMEYNLANVLAARGEHEEAHAHRKRALDLWTQLLGPNHPDVAFGLRGLAADAVQRGEYPKAMEHLQKARAIIERTRGRDHPSLAAVYGNLGGMAIELGHYAQARGYLERSIELRREAFGDESPRLAFSLANLARVLEEQGEHDEARVHLKRAIELYVAGYGEDSQGTSDLVLAFGDFLFRTGDPAGAAVEHRRALAIARRVAGPDAPALAWPLTALAGDLAALGNRREALRMYERAIALAEPAHGVNHPATAEAMVGLGVLHRVAGRTRAAVDLLGKAAAAFEAIEAEPVEQARAAFEFAQALWQNGDHDRAIATASGARAAAASAGDRGATRVREIDRWLAAR